MSVDAHLVTALAELEQSDSAEAQAIAAYIARLERGIGAWNDGLGTSDYGHDSDLAESLFREIKALGRSGAEPGQCP